MAVPRRLTPGTQVRARRRSVLLLATATGLLAGAAVALALGGDWEGNGRPGGRDVGGDDGGRAGDARLVTWTMVDVTHDGVQGDAHLVEAAGRRILIDAGTEAGAAQRLLPFLARHAVRSLDVVVISHAHRDHYGGLRPLLDAGIDVGEVWWQTPDAGVCAREIPWGCDPGEIDRYRSLVLEHGVELVEASAGRELPLSDRARLTVVHAPGGGTTPVEPADVNDTSLIMRLDAGDTSALFTGDLNEPLGAWLADHPVPLARHRILKVPHHGAERTAPDEFFATVDPDAALVPGPVETWCTDRSARVRRWLDAHGVPTYVSGLHGHVTVEVREGGEATVTTERRATHCPTPAPSRARS